MLMNLVTVSLLANACRNACVGISLRISATTLCFLMLVSCPVENGTWMKVLLDSCASQGTVRYLSLIIYDDAGFVVENGSEFIYSWCMVHS